MRIRPATHRGIERVFHDSYYVSKNDFDITDELERRVFLQFVIPADNPELEGSAPNPLCGICFINVHITYYTISINAPLIHKEWSVSVSFKKGEVKSRWRFCPETL